MTDKERIALVNRLKSVAGHVSAVVRMVEQDEYCIDIIKQIQATEAALSKVSQLILDDHLHHCVITAIQGHDQAERERVLAEIGEVFAVKNN
jgi:CsoR family transcriptional regulator, copper-sensing transcriptional repressor